MVSNKGTGDGFVVSFSYSGERCYKLMGDSSLWKSLSQEIKLSGSAGAVLTVSGHSRVENPNPSGGMYGCIIETYLDDTKQETFTFHFDKSKTHDWQHQAAEIKATRSFDKVKVYYEYSQQSGAAWFDTAKVSVGSITTRHQYDANGNYEVKTTDPQGRVTESEYDTVGNQTSEKVGAHTTTFEYDGLDRLKKVIDAKNGITQYQYDANGNKTRVTNASDKETTYQYNEIDQVSRVTDANNQSTTYDYDELDQLVKETAPDGTITEYTYGAAGNRTPKKVTRDGTTITNTYTYDDADQLTAVNGQAYTYDENGNLTNDGSKTYAYDAENRLTQVQSGSETVQFAYRADSMRTRMTTNAGTTYFQYDENKNVSIETNASGQVIASLYL